MLELTQQNLEESLPEDAALVTASALIDLVSQEWLRSFAQAVIRRQAGVLVVLSYSGHFELAPPHGSDALIKELVNQHQHGDKGSGAALGPEATAVLKQLLQEAGYTVTAKQTRWQLGACQQSPAAEAEIRAWLADRQRQLARHELQVMVGHLDILGLPESGLPG
jgi:hypothetical protein